MTCLHISEMVPWVDPLSGLPMKIEVASRTPAGVPMHGALRILDTNHGYPIVDCVARVSPNLARKYSDWLEPFGLVPPNADSSLDSYFQRESTVESFGFQWNWRGEMRSEADLRWRIADRFQLSPQVFSGKLVLDAGSGCGDQSRWLLDHGATVISVDLSSAIDLTAFKLRMTRNWFGIQCDLARMPISNAFFDVVYCEGVIQHTQDSEMTVRSLCGYLKPSGLVLATHYSKPRGLLGITKFRLQSLLRRLLSRLEHRKIFLVSGVIAAIAYVPIIGYLARKTGMAIHYKLMPDFVTTWVNTYDYYGTHEFQRHISSEEFWNYFDKTGKMIEVYRDGTVVVARKRAT